MVSRDHNSWGNIDLLPNEAIIAKIFRDQLRVNQPPTSTTKAKPTPFLKAIGPGLNGEGCNLLADECEEAMNMCFDMLSNCIQLI